MFMYKNLLFTRLSGVVQVQNEMNGATAAEMEYGVAGTEQSTQWRRVRRTRRDTRLRMRKTNKGLDPTNSTQLNIIAVSLVD